MDSEHVSGRGVLCEKGKELVAVFTHFLAAPVPEKSVSVLDLESLVKELLQEGLLRLPGTIYVGDVDYEPRFDDTVRPIDTDEADKLVDEFQETISTFLMKAYERNSIIPNDSFQMIARARSEQNNSWYTGKGEEGFLEALRQAPFGQQNVCLCFPNLGQRLQDWDGAVIYTLTKPAVIDFADPSGYGSYRLLERELTRFFTMVSRRAAGYPDLVNNPLTPTLKRCFGTDFALAQSYDRKTWGPYRYQA